MKVKYFGARPSRNVSTGGQRPLSDPFNKSFKGDPFNKEYKKEISPYAEYSSYGSEEYHHYPEQKDLTAEQDDQKNAEENRRRDQKAKNAAARRKRMIQQAVCVAVGSIVIVTSYNASVAQRNAQPTEDPTPSIVDPATPDEPSPDDSKSYSAAWQWNEDNTQATCVVTDLTGNVVGEIPAAITTSEVPAGCSTEGKMIYTATAQFDGQSFTDSCDRVLPALGHSFDDGTEVTLSDGRTAMEFECARCHEHFTIVNSIDEE